MIEVFDPKPNLLLLLVREEGDEVDDGLQDYIKGVHRTELTARVLVDHRIEQIGSGDAKFAHPDIYIYIGKGELE